MPMKRLASGNNDSTTYTEPKKSRIGVSESDQTRGSEQQLNNQNYAIGWICTIATEYLAAQVFLDEKHDQPEYVHSHDNNDYTLGRVGKHNVVIAALPDGEYGVSLAAGIISDMLLSFSNVRVVLMVGIGGGAPSSKHDIRLGDIVVNAPSDGKGGVFQYDFDKTAQNQSFQPIGFPNQPPMVVRTAINGLKVVYESNGHQLDEAINNIIKKKPRLRKKYSRPDSLYDRFYQSTITHPPNDEANCAVTCGDDLSNLIPRQERTEDEDNPAIHYGLIASANKLMKNALLRDKLARENDILCFDLEAAGLTSQFPCLVIRGICDYSDTHRNKEWQGYAAMSAAAYAKDVLCRVPPNKIETERKISTLLSTALRGGFMNPVKSVSDQGTDENALDGEHNNGPQGSSARSDEPIMKPLINEGFNINAQNGIHGNELTVCDVEASTALCDGCTKIDFKATFSLKIRRSQGVLVRRLGHFNPAWAIGTCQLCQLLAAMCLNTPTFEAANETASYELRAFSSFIIYGFGRRDVSNSKIPKGLQDAVFLGVVRDTESSLKGSWAATGFIALNTCNQIREQWQFKPRSVNPILADFDIIKGWLSFCRENHGKQCTFQESKGIKNLWLIDCHTRRIISASPKETYAALSYVWGNQTTIHDETTQGLLPEILPRTIEDAMTATILFGMKYIWIDRYCIPQNDNDERHIQILQMDSVYSNAEITIIAAAGDDPTFGLPGMGSAIRVPQQSIQTSAGMLMSTLPDGKFAIEESLWNTRGWTYQEAILSRRRLVFTRYQIYFQCNGMHCCESVEKPLGILHVKTQQRMRAFNGDGPFNATGPGSHPWEVLHRISEFSRRKLSFQSDVLNAMTGILSAFRGMKRPVYHHFGVPSLPPVFNTQKIGKAFGKLVSLVSLPMNPDHGLATGLCWYLEEPSKRRANFPSWSWTGWMGPVAKPDHGHLQYYFGFPEGYLDVKIWVELEDKSLRRWEDEFLACGSIHGRRYSQYLHLDVNTILIQPILTSPPTSGTGITGSTPLTVNTDPTFDAEIVVNDPQQHDLAIRCKFILTRKVDLDSPLCHRLCNEPWRGILFGPQYLESKDARGRGGFVMVIDYLDGYWERIGHLNLIDVETNWHHQASRLSFSVTKQIIRLR